VRGIAFLSSAVQHSTMFPSGPPDVGTVTLLVGVTAVHVALFVLLVRHQRAVRAAERVEAPDDRVGCRECGTANQAEYTFCRACVEQLPGAATVGGDRGVSAESAR